MIGSNTNKGFTVFFAVLVSSLALAVGLAIYDLLIREVALAQTTAQSQLAISAADTGVECALYWDQKFVDATTNNHGGSNSVFATTTASSPQIDWFPVAVGSGRYCNSLDITSNTYNATISGNSGNGWYINPVGTTFATTSFYVSQGTTATAPCAWVEVGKRGNPPTTLIISHGYNTCTSGLIIRLERSLQVSY